MFDDDEYDCLIDEPVIPHMSEYHDYLHSTRDVGDSFVGYHEWHMDNYGDFGIS